MLSGSFNRNFFFLIGTTNLNFHLPVSSLAAYSKTYGITDKVGVIEFNASPFIPIVEQDIYIKIEQFIIQFLSHGNDGFIFHINREDDGFKRSRGNRPNNPFVIMQLFNRSRYGSRNSDAVTSHDERFSLAVFIKEGRIQTFGILRTQAEYLSYFDALSQFDFAAAFGAYILFRNKANRCRLHVFKIASRRYVTIVIAVFIGTGYTVFNLHSRFIYQNDEIIILRSGVQGTHISRFQPVSSE